jgi:hypothetical protein
MAKPRAKKKDLLPFALTLLERADAGTCQAITFLGAAAMDARLAPPVLEICLFEVDEKPYVRMLAPEQCDAIQDVADQGHDKVLKVVNSMLDALIKKVYAAANGLMQPVGKGVTSKSAGDVPTPGCCTYDGQQAGLSQTQCDCFPGSQFDPNPCSPHRPR